MWKSQKFIHEYEVINFNCNLKTNPGLDWMSTAQGASFQVLLFSDAVIVNLLRKSQILITFMNFATRRAQCMAPGIWKWTPRSRLPLRKTTDNSRNNSHLVVASQ